MEAQRFNFNNKKVNLDNCSIQIETEMAYKIATTEDRVLANPVLFAKPILNVKGKLSFWEYPMELCHVCGQPTELICQICDKPFCDNHSAIYDQFNQIDYDCCFECAEAKKWGEL